jgi:alpha-galactosidase
MRDALNKTGHPIFYSICNWGYEETVKWGPETGNSWRTTMDIKGIWASI